MESSSTTPFDPRTLEEQCKAREDQVRLVSLLVEDLRRHSTDLIAAVSKGDGTSAARAAHSIAGAGALVASVSVFDSARNLERRIKAGEVTSVSDHVETLGSLVMVLVDALEGWKTDPSATTAAH
jgi:hypothetical protein